MMKISHLFALTLATSVTSVFGVSKVATANFCQLPSNIDPTGILCQAQGVIDSTQQYINQELVPAANQRQQYLQELYNVCMAGYHQYCDVYNYEMQRQLQHMDRVLEMQRQYYQYNQY